MSCTQYRYHTLQPLTVFDFVFPLPFPIVWKRNYDAQRVARIQFLLNVVWKLRAQQ